MERAEDGVEGFIRHERKPGEGGGGKLELIVLNISEALMGSAYSSITSTNRIPRVVQH